MGSAIEQSTSDCCSRPTWRAINEVARHCFHCGIRRPLGERPDALSGILQSLYEESHRALLAGNNPAYHYLVDAVGLHPAVVRDSMVGIAAEDMDPSGRFVAAIQEAERALEDATPKKAG